MRPPSIEQLLAEFRALPVPVRALDAVRLGAQRKVGGLWGASAGLFLAAIAQTHKSRMLIAVADDLDSLQLQTDMQSFGAQALVLPRQETNDEGLPDPQTRSDRHRALRRASASGSILIGGIEALLQPAPVPKEIKKGQVVLRKG